MPYYRSGYNRYRRWPYRSWRRGVSAASRSGVRTFTCIVPTNAQFSALVNSGAFWSQLEAVSPYYYDPDNQLTRCSLLSSTLYKTYTRIYDQVKINWVSVKISLMTNVGSGGVVPACKIHTMWDRQASAIEIVGGEDLPTVTTIQNGSESQVTILANNSRCIISRFIRARDLQERTTFHDCSYAVFGSGSSAKYTDRAFCANPTVASSAGSAANIGFVPCLYWALNPSASLSAAQYYNIAIDCRWSVTFRNPKYGLGVEGNSKFSEMKGDVIDEIVEESKEEEAPSEGVALRKKVKKEEPVYEEEVLPDDDDTLIEMDDEDEEQEPLTQKKTILKKAVKKSSS